MKSRKQIVIFSSGEQKDTITQLANVLNQYDCQCTLWMELFTRQKEKDKFALLPALLKKIPTFDFAIILATPDERIKRCRKDVVEEFTGMRDNVIFEIGLCTMALGCNRTILLQHKDVYLFDDLIGVPGIHSSSNFLSASALGVKCFTYNDEDNLKALFDDIAQYIDIEQQEYSPIIIGAACSTAIGYFNMYIKRISSLLADYPFKGPKKLLIMVPEYITKTINKDIDEYYLAHNYEKINITTNEGRNISTYTKIKGDKMIICDIPTSISASYQTIQAILSVDASDIHDANAEYRFLKKEANLFYLTLKKLLATHSLPRNVSVSLSTITLPGM